MARIYYLAFLLIIWIFLVSCRGPQPLAPTSASAPAEIPLDTNAFELQSVEDGEEQFLDIRRGDLCRDLSNHTLEVVFDGGDEKEIQLFFKDEDFRNAYSRQKVIVSGEPLRFNPEVDPSDVFDEGFMQSCINLVGVKVVGEFQDVEITSARLFK